MNLNTKAAWKKHVRQQHVTAKEKQGWYGQCVHLGSSTLSLWEMAHYVRDFPLVRQRKHSLTIFLSDFSCDEKGVTARKKEMLLKGEQKEEKWLKRRKGLMGEKEKCEMNRRSKAQKTEERK